MYWIFKFYTATYYNPCYFVLLYEITLVALLINPDYSSAFPLTSNGIMIDQDNYREAKSSQTEHAMQVEREEANDIMSTR